MIRVIQLAKFRSDTTAYVVVAAIIDASSILVKRDFGLL